MLSKSVDNLRSFGVKKTRIVIADDHPLMRQALKMWIETQEDLEVIAEACDGKEVVTIASKLYPDLIIMDISLPKLNGLSATKQILAICPETEVLVFTVHADNQHIIEMIRAGASGYVTKDASGEEILHAIRCVISGETILPPNISLENVKDAFCLNSDKEYKLNDREVKLLQLLANGLSNKEIGLRLGISLHRVKANLTILFAKLNVSSRTEAISVGLKNGIISFDHE